MTDILDFDRINELSGEIGLDILEMLADEFFDDIGSRQQEISTLLDEKVDLQSLQELAHELKGIAANLGLGLLSQTASDVSDKCKGGHLEQAFAAAQKISSSVSTSQSALKEHIVAQS